MVICANETLGVHSASPASVARKQEDDAMRAAGASGPSCACEYESCLFWEPIQPAPLPLVALCPVPLRYTGVLVSPSSLVRSALGRLRCRISTSGSHCRRISPRRWACANRGSNVPDPPDLLLLHSVDLISVLFSSSCLSTRDASYRCPVLPASSFWLQYTFLSCPPTASLPLQSASRYRYGRGPAIARSYYSSLLAFALAGDRVVGKRERLIAFTLLSFHSIPVGRSPKGQGRTPWTRSFLAQVH